MLFVGLLAMPARAAFPGKNGRLAFASSHAGNDEIYVMYPDGSGLARLTSNAFQDNEPSWPPDGGRIAFTSNRDAGGGLGYEIYVMNADGSGQMRLSDNPANDMRPAWAPDGSRIAFDSSRAGGYDIYVMNADGSGQTRLTGGPGQGTTWSQGAAWSPDGTKVAFHSLGNGNADIYVINADGTGQTRLTTHAESDSWPAWSPDGTRIAFVSQRDGNFEIYVMSADGTGQARLTATAADDSIPRWSPDGTKIAFDSNRDGDPDIYTMNRDGTEQRRMPNSPPDVQYGSDWQPMPFVISPAGGLVGHTQGFDLTLFLTKPGVSLISVAATLNGQDVSSQLAACIVPGTLVFGRTYRCPNLRASLVGAGLHTLAVTLNLSDGTSVSETAYYTVLANTEP